jgi:micrococcal nuclease
LPWNALFWITTPGLTGLGAWLSTEVEVKRELTHGVDKAADIQDGDLVDVVVVLNGDELLVTKDGNRAKIRLIGVRAFDAVINEFELTAFGRASVGFLEHWVSGHEVKVRFDSTPKDVHGRYLVYMERDGIDINRRMIEEGVAMVYTEYPFTREAAYLSSEQLARESNRGIWGGPRAVARINGLRHDWRRSRTTRTSQPFADPLGVP